MLLDLVSRTWKVLPKGVRTFIARSIQPKFTVSVTAIVTNEQGEVLLLDHLLRPLSGWGPPGGFVESGEQPERALRRELKEETTLDLADVRIIRARTFKRHIEIIYTAKAVGEARVVSREIRSLQWFMIDDIPREMSLDLQFVIRKALTEPRL